MSATIPANTLEKFSTFGDLLRFLRRRVGLTQTELSIAVGYSTSQISRLEQNLRLPDLPTIEARFEEALDLQDDPRAVARLLDLAANVRREDAPAPGLCPYKGLSYFDENDADLFVGREALTARLAERVLLLASRGSDGAGRFLAVVGASGSGKSSLVRAGLVPTLRWKKEFANWQLRILTPTARPLESLAVGLTPEGDSVLVTSGLMDDLARDPRSLHLFVSRTLDRKNGARLLLVVDQFEELFALCRSEEERAAFIANLLEAACEPGGPVALVITLRADFYAYCASYPDLRQALALHQEYIGAMSSEELRRAIEEPARRGHWELEPGLADLLLHDVGQEPGALPLLSHALLETWERRRGTLLTLSGYAASGGVRGAIAETAEAVFTDQFNPQQQAIARRIFVRLTELGDATAAADTRRRATFSELILRPEEAGTTQSVLKALADARLIITSEDSAEVAHEALIREWPTLRGWLEDNREGLRLHRSLTEAAQVWQELERTPDMLLRGMRLGRIQEWANLHGEDLNLLEREYLDASVQERERAAWEREQQQARELESALKLAGVERSATNRLRVRNRIISGVGVLALALAVLAGMFGLSSRANARSADDQRNVAQSAQATAQAERQAADAAAAISLSRELAAQSQLSLATNPERSILLALAGLARSDTLEAENALHAAVLGSRLRLSLSGHTGTVNDVVYSRDGRFIATAGADGTARIWDAATGKQLWSLQHLTAVKFVLFNPEGTRLITGAEDGTVWIWEVASGRNLIQFSATQTRMNQAESILDTGDFYGALSPDGKLLATSVPFDGLVRLWDPSSGTELFTLNDPDWSTMSPGVPGHPYGIVFSPDGKRLAINVDNGDPSVPARIEMWDLVARHRLFTVSDLDINSTLRFSLSPDGTRLAAPEGNAGAVWDASSGKLLFKFGDLHLNMIVYSADGKYMLGASGGGRVEVFNAQTGKVLLMFYGHAGRTFAVAGSPGCDAPPSAAFPWCGSRLASAGEDGAVRIWDISPAGEQELLTVPAIYFALGSDGRQLATVGSVSGNFPAPGETVTFEQRQLPPGAQPGAVSGYASSLIKLDEHFRADWFLREQGLFAAAFDDGPIKFWDVLNGGKPVYPVSCCIWTSASMLLSVSHQPSLRLAWGNPQAGTETIWDLRTNTEVRTLQIADPNDPNAAPLDAAAISPDGNTLLTMKADATVETWDLKTGRKQLTLPGPSSADGAYFYFSPDGILLVTADCTGTAVVRDAGSGAEIGRFSQVQSCVQGIAFSPDDQLIALTSNGRQTTIWNVKTGKEVLALPGGFDVQFTPDGTRLFLSREFTPLTLTTVNAYVLRASDLVALAKTRVTRSLTPVECQQYLHNSACPAGP